MAQKQFGGSYSLKEAGLLISSPDVLFLFLSKVSSYYKLSPSGCSVACVNVSNALPLNLFGFHKRLYF